MILGRERGHFGTLIEQDFTTKTLKKFAFCKMKNVTTHRAVRDNQMSHG